MDSLFDQIIFIAQTDQTKKYLTVATSALVVYDQVLTFTQEVDHIWSRQWGPMTGLYLIARCSGSLSIIGTAVYTYINWLISPEPSINMFLAITWAQKIYLLTMQAILAIRVYALFNRSKKVLIFLVIFYCLQTIGILVMAGLSYNDRLVHNYLIASNDANTTTQVLDADSSIRLSSQIATILSFAVNTVSDTVLLFFALWAFVRHSLEARTLHGGWSVNVLVKTLVADHLLYFVCNLIWLLLTLINVYLPELPTFTEFLDDAVLIVFNALAVVAGPRMVISLRETENKTRGEGGTWEGELSTIRFGMGAPLIPRVLPRLGGEIYGSRDLFGVARCASGWQMMEKGERGRARRRRRRSRAR